MLLIDERPEEVTHMRRAVRGEVVASSNDETLANHVRIARLMIEKAKRLVEAGGNVVMFLDSLTRLGRTFNAFTKGTGRIMSGGLDSRGTGAEGTVKDAKVLVSTAQMSRSIADVYVCRKDFYDANKETVEKFVAGYLKACEDVVALKKQFEKTGSSPKYMETLKLAQSIYGTEVLPTLEVDAHGLVADCTYVGMPGNLAFA